MKASNFRASLLALVAIAFIFTRREIIEPLSVTRVNNLEITGTTDATGVVTARAGVRLTTLTTGPLFTSGSGSPNGALAATLGSLYLRTDTAEVYQNTDGATAWKLLPVFSGASAYDLTPITAPDASWRGVPGDAENFDTDNYHDNVTTPGRMVVPTAGYYLVHVVIAWAPSAAGYRAINIRKNAGGVQAGGTSLCFCSSTAITSGGTFTVPECSVIVLLTPPDYVEVFVYQNTGGPLDFNTDIDVPYQISRLGS